MRDSVGDLVADGFDLALRFGEPPVGPELLRSGRLVELFPEWSDERFPLYAVYPSRLHRAAKVRAFIEFCLEIMGGYHCASYRSCREDS
jgi:hypothetical protein